jgi:hypothetical protein
MIKVPFDCRAIACNLDRLSYDTAGIQLKLSWHANHDLTGLLPRWDDFNRQASSRALQSPPMTLANPSSYQSHPVPAWPSM